MVYLKGREGGYKCTMLPSFYFKVIKDFRTTDFHYWMEDIKYIFPISIEILLVIFVFFMMWYFHRGTNLQYGSTHKLYYNDISCEYILFSGRPCEHSHTIQQQCRNIVRNMDLMHHDLSTLPEHVMMSDYCYTIYQQSMVWECRYSFCSRHISDTYMNFIDVTTFILSESLKVCTCSQAELVRDVMDEH